MVAELKKETSEHLDGSSPITSSKFLTSIMIKYINNSRHLAREYARIFVRGHYLIREANSFPRAKLEENNELRGTDNVQGLAFSTNYKFNFY